MTADFDLIILGAGFGGSLLAMIARQIGRSVLLVERARHPRFAIGESSTPLANLLWEELAARYGLPELAPFAKWGSWQRAHPEISCGLKRGFTFYHHSFGLPFESRADRGNELLVAASPRDEIGDTHWYRAEFDHFLVRRARARGVECFEETEIESVQLEAGGARLQVRAEGKSWTARARLVIDATGPCGLLWRALQLPERSFGKLPPTQTVYAHFEGVRRWADLFPSAETPPYPVDDAALHHVFSGGWIWVLRFNNGLVSAGAAATGNLAGRIGFGEGAPGWNRLLNQLPSVAKQFENARPVGPFRYQEKLAFLSGAVAGPRWALLPSAAGFVDPLLSTGFPLALLGIQRLALLLEADPGQWERGLPDYGRITARELVSVGLLIAALYSAMDDFELFAALSLLYFAAASFTETARRLGKPELAGSMFLLGDHPVFGPSAGRCIEQIIGRAPGRLFPREAFLKEIYQTIAPVDVAGLSDWSRRNWFPALAEDLRRNAGKLEATPDAIDQMLRRVGF